MGILVPSVPWDHTEMRLVIGKSGPGSHQNQYGGVLTTLLVRLLSSKEVSVRRPNRVAYSLSMIEKSAARPGWALLLKC